jgi:pimeloyl-ACP methyl ester carboxylesterase
MGFVAEHVQFEERMFFVRAGGHNLRTMTLNPSNPPDGNESTLVFIHEGLGSIGQWRDFPFLLAEATGLGAVVYERYGFGGSDPLQEPRDVGYLGREAHDVLPELLAECGVSAPILIGHSDGGTIALQYAARFPESPRGVISEAAHVFVEEISLSGIREAVKAFETGGLREKLARYHGDRTDAMFHGWCDTWQTPEFLRWNITGQLADIRCPLLAIQGEDDEYGTAAQLQTICDRVSGPVERLMVPDCGHIPHQQARDTVLREMTRFIGQLK